MFLYLSYGEAAELDTCFYRLQLSTEHHVWVSIIAPGWGSVNLNQFAHHLPRIQQLLMKRERWISKNRGVISYPYPLVETFIFLP